MPITWRPATLKDIESGLSIQPRYLGDAIVGRKAAAAIWKRLGRHRFFISCVMESSLLPPGDRIVCFGASVIVTDSFADAELANPHPDINSRLVASLHGGKPVLATSDEVARSNAGAGVNVFIVYSAWREDILNPEDLQSVLAFSPASFTELHAGYRIRQIFQEPAGKPELDLVRRSIEFRAVAEFPEDGRVLFRMNRESVQGIPGSLANAIFSRREPCLHLRDSDQQLLLAGLKGLTDSELADELEISFSAVKARWRSTFARIADSMPSLVTDTSDREGRGLQKRHRVLSYVRNHMEELRPYDWQLDSNSSTSPRRPKKSPGDQSTSQLRSESEGITVAR